MPAGVYPNIFIDYGYVNNTYIIENRSKLSNRLIYGAGFGLDFVTYYNMVIRFNYAINDRKERNFVFGIGREF